MTQVKERLAWLENSGTLGREEHAVLQDFSKMGSENLCSSSARFISTIALLGINAFRRKKRVILF